jgi:putative tricarboxylic transport membrane protein
MNCRGAIVAIRFAVWLLVCALGAVPTVARAQYPEKPITILVGYDVDSVGDQVARGLAEAAKKHLPKPILVVNRPGASGTLAISEALAAKPSYGRKLVTA